MKKIDSLRRFFLPCISPTTNTSKTTTNTTTTTTTTKKRLSTTLRDNHHQQEDEDSTTTTEESVNNYSVPPRSSKSMVIGTLFGHRRGHVSFCIQHHRLNSKPFLFLQFSIPTYVFVQEMKCGLVRIALESNHTDMSLCPLHSIPIWTMCINGRKVGFATKRRANDKDRLILKTMQSTTVGAGVIPDGLIPPSEGEGEGEGEGEIIYMRANFERVVGGPDSESFYLISPDECPGQELSVFLMRAR